MRALLATVALVAAVLSLRYGPVTPGVKVQGPQACAAVEFHMAPDEALDVVDTRYIASARFKIDVAASVLSSSEVIEALQEAQARGVAVRIVLEGRETSALARLQGLEVRFRLDGPLLSLKSYALDGLTLRTGSSNLTMSGEREDENEITVLRDAAAASRFEARFEQLWASSTPMN
jgi:phosphatidylserine/phosphatidylglycerophosphate/cardiolipin synthase-like enzyme